MSVVDGMARRGHQSPPVTAPVPRYCADSPACSLLRCVWRFVPDASRRSSGGDKRRGQIGAIRRSPQEFQRERAGAVLDGSADDALRRTRSIPPPVMLFLRSAYLVGDRTPHQPSSQVRRSLVRCLRPSLLPRAHLSRRPLPSEPRHHRSSRRAARFARAGRPQSARRLGRSAPGCSRAGPRRPAPVGLVAGWWRGTRGSPARGAWCARRRQSAAAAGSRPPPGQSPDGPARPRPPHSERR